MLAATFELTDYVQVLVNDKDLRAGAMQDYDIAFLAGKIIDRVDRAEQFERAKDAERNVST